MGLEILVAQQFSCLGRAEAIVCCCHELGATQGGLLGTGEATHFTHGWYRIPVASGADRTGPLGGTEAVG